MNRQQLQLAIHDTDASIEFLHNRWASARSEMLDYLSEIEDAENYLTGLQEQLNELGDE